MGKNEFTTDIVIIGAGPAGLFTVFQAGMLGMKAVVIDNLNHIGGQCNALYPEKPIYDIPGYPVITAAELIKKLEIQAAPFKPTYLLNQLVESLQHKGDNGWILKTSKNNIIFCKAVIIAAGCGAFVHNRPPLADIELYEGKNVFYNITDQKQFQDKKIVIAGGGDSALDWALTLSQNAEKIYIVHRREKFRALSETLRKVRAIAESGKIEFVIPYQLHKLKTENNSFSGVEVIDYEGNIRVLEADYLLPFFGLKMDLGPIAGWGLNIHNHHIAVDYSTMQTNAKGIFAIGDVATYEGKLKLILTGFAESALACHNAYKYVYPDKALHFEYSTNKGLPL